MCIPSHRLKRLWHSCLKWVNAGNKNTPSMHHPRRRNVATSVVGLKDDHIHENLTQNGEPQRYSWGNTEQELWWHTPRKGTTPRKNWIKFYHQHPSDPPSTHSSIRSYWGVPSLSKGWRVGHSLRLYHFCDMMLTALWCLVEIEKSVFWTRRKITSAHDPVMLVNVVNQSFAKYCKL